MGCGGIIEGRANERSGIIRSKHFWGGIRSKARIEEMVGQDRLERNIVSLTQHDYYGSYLQDYTYIAYIQLLAFSVWMSGKGGRKRSWN